MRRACVLILIALSVFLLGPDTELQTTLDTATDTALDTDPTAAPAPSGNLTTLAASDWGTGETYDLTSKVPVGLVLEDDIPIDTSGWTVDNIACTTAALNAAMTPAQDDTVIQFPTNCQITYTGTGDIFQLPNSINGLVIRGNADGLSEIIIDPGADPASDGWSQRMFDIGNTAGTITSWTWTGGFGRDDDVLTSGSSISDLYVGDWIRITINTWGNGNTANYTRFFKVVGARWFNATEVGDQTGISANNSIKIDHVLGWDTSGAQYDNLGSFTGHTIHHIERLGGGVTDDDQVVTHFGIENMTLSHTEPFGVKKSFHQLEFESCNECWLTGNRFKSHADANISSVVAGSVGRVLIRGNYFGGDKELFASRCKASVTSITVPSEPLEMVIDGSDVACRTWCTGLEPWIYFPTDFGDASHAPLRGKVARCTTADGTPDTSVTVTLVDKITNATYEDSGMSTSPGANWVMQLKQYDIAAIYTNQSSDMQIIDNIFHNTRVGVIHQNMSAHAVVAYNYLHFDLDYGCSRGWFVHGGLLTQGLWEGNDANCSYTLIESSENGQPIGPEFTLFKNRGRQRGGTVTGAEGDQYGGAGVDGGWVGNGSTDQGGTSNEKLMLLANHLGGGYYGAFPYFDDCDNGDSGQTCVTGSPFQWWKMELHKNIWWGEEMNGDFEPGGEPGTIKPDIDAGGNDNVDAAPGGWATFDDPGSLLYDLKIQGDSSFQPSWWCTESGTFGDSIGAFADDRNGGLPTAPNYDKLPAQIRYESGTCS